MEIADEQAEVTSVEWAVEIAGEGVASALCMPDVKEGSRRVVFVEVV